MEVKEEKKDNSVIKLDFNIPVDELNKDISEIYDKLKESVEVPGFRKGKVPEGLLKKKFSKHVEQQMLSEKVPELVKNHIKEKEYKIISEVNFQGMDYKDGEPLNFSIEFEVLPEFEIKDEDYKNIEVTKLPVEVSEDDVKQEINRLLERNAEYKPVERKVQLNDIVYVNMNAKIDGNIVEGSELTNFSIPVKKIEKDSKKDLKDEVNERIINKKQGDELNFEFTFAEDFKNENLKGKTADIYVRIDRVEERILAELDDEFAKEMEYESLDDMKTKIKEKLEENKKMNSENKLKNDILDKIVENVSIPVPSTLIRRYNQSQFKRFLQRLYYQNLTADKYFELTNTTEEQWFENNKKNAEKEVKIDLITEKVAETENIQPTKQEISDKLEQQSKMYKKDKTEMKRYLIKNELWESFKDEIKRTKVVEFLINESKIKEN